MKRFASPCSPLFPLLFAVLALLPAVATGQTTRTFTLHNMCPFPVFPGATVGAVGGAKSPVLCNGGACPDGQVCNPSNNQCYWDALQTQAGEHLDGYTLELTAGGARSTAKVDIPIHTMGASDTIWSGGIWAGTDVPGSGSMRTAATAATGYCAASQNGMWQVIPCADQITAPQNAPTTKAEFTLVNSQDTYDITAINGISIPLEMSPTPDQMLPMTPESNDPNLKYYWCKGAGAVTVPETPARSCGWSFDSMNNGVGMALVQHRTGAALCGPTRLCPSGETCGIAYDSSQGVSGVFQECGTRLSGSWTAVQICAAIGYDNTNLKNVSPELKQSLDCQGPGGINAALFKCHGHGSCYDASANTSCCGCPDWSPDYKPLGGNPTTANRCYNTNDDWRRIAFPWLPYIKTACPTMYSYQYDDVTSTFTCSSAKTGAPEINQTNYTITFCPEGRTTEVGAAARFRGMIPRAP